MAQIKCVFNNSNGDNTGTYCRTGKSKSFSSPGILLKRNCPNGEFIIDDSDAGNGYYLLVNPQNYGLPNQKMYVYINKSFIASMTSMKTTTNTTATNSRPVQTATNTNTSSNITSNANSTVDSVGDVSTFVYGSELDSRITELLSENTRLNDFNTVTRIIGAPFQFTKETDCRPYSNLNIGRQFMENIMLEAPIVSFVPGLPSYLADFDATNRKVIEEYLSSKRLDTSISPEVMDKIRQTEGRYFDFIGAYDDYMKYVNALCRMAAIYIGLADKTVPGTDTLYKNYDWSRWEKDLSETYAEKQKAKGREGIWDQVTEFTENATTAVVQALVGDQKYIRCYIDPSVSVSENSSNSTTQSAFAGLFDQVEGLGKDIMFFMGGSQSAMGTILGDLGGAATGTAQSVTDNFNATSNISRLLGLTDHVVSGSNIIFPELWGDSAYGKSFNISVNLVSPYGDVECIFLNIIVPLMHLVCLGLPRQTSANSFASPFLVKVFAKGLFSCEMGMVEGISIEKRGGQGDAYTIYGLPLEVKVTLNVKDLYSNLMMTKSTTPQLFLHNQGLIEWLATTCGMDITKPVLPTKIESFISGFMNKIYDIPSNITDTVIQSWRNAIEPWFKIGRN